MHMLSRYLSLFFLFKKQNISRSFFMASKMTLLLYHLFRSNWKYAIYKNLCPPYIFWNGKSFWSWNNCFNEYRVFLSSIYGNVLKLCFIVRKMSWEKNFLIVCFLCNLRTTSKETIFSFISLTILLDLPEFVEAGKTNLNYNWDISYYLPSFWYLTAFGLWFKWLHLKIVFIKLIGNIYVYKTTHSCKNTILKQHYKIS